MATAGAVFGPDSGLLPSMVRVRHLDCSLEKSKLYDWIQDRGAPGLLCHLWVTKNRQPDGVSPD